MREKERLEGEAEWLNDPEIQTVQFPENPLYLVLGGGGCENINEPEVAKNQATWYITGLYLGSGIGFFLSFAVFIQASFAFNTSRRASDGVRPKAEQCFRSCFAD